MSKKKIFVVVTTGALSLALIGNGAFTVYADGDLAPSADSVTPPPGVQQVPEEKPEQKPQNETPPVQPNLPPESNSTPPSEKPAASEPEPKQKSSQPKVDSKSDDVKPESDQPAPKQEPESAKQSESSNASEVSGLAKSDSKPGSHVVADAGKAKEESEEGKEEESSAESKGDAQGEKMAKTGFNPVPFAQMAAGLFGLGGSALYGMRRSRRSDD